MSNREEQAMLIRRWFLRGGSGASPSRPQRMASPGGLGERDNPADPAAGAVRDAEDRATHPDEIAALLSARFRR
jgi:hypothetical protein